MVVRTQNCEQCGIEFLYEQLRGSRRKYCSKLCLHRSKLPYCRAWYARNKAYANAKAREWHHNNRERHILRARKYYRENRDALVIDMRKKLQTARKETPWVTLIASAKHRAIVRKLPFNLTNEWGRANWTGRCALSGIPFAIAASRHSPRMFWPSIDRIDAKLGYIQSNCRFVLYAVNSMRVDGTDGEMFFIASALALNIKPTKRIA